MRYFTSVVDCYHAVELSWSDFIVVRQRNETSSRLIAFGRLFSSYILRDGEKLGGRLGDWSAENATNVAYFISHSSKYAYIQDWMEIRSWFSRQEPSVQAMLVKARAWFQRSSRRNMHNWSASFGSLICCDLNHGTVVMMVHVDHSDC